MKHIIQSYVSFDLYVLAIMASVCFIGTTLVATTGEPFRQTVMMYLGTILFAVTTKKP